MIAEARRQTQRPVVGAITQDCLIESGGELDKALSVGATDDRVLVLMETEPVILCKHCSRSAPVPAGGRYLSMGDSGRVADVASIGTLHHHQALQTPVGIRFLVRALVQRVGRIRDRILW